MSVAPRIIFVGDSGVGKTSIIHRCKHGRFENFSIPTIGAGVTPLVSVEDGKTYEYQLWDTAGQEIYKNIVPMYFKGASCAVIVYSVSDKKSFMSVESWLTQLYNHADEGIGIIVVGNKCDRDDQCVSNEEAKQWADTRKLPILFSSAKTGENIDMLLEMVVSKYVIPMYQPRAISPTTVDLNKTPKTGCC